MAESQLMCMEDGRIGTSARESEPEFYYSEGQRLAIEELLRNGDGAYKTRLKDDKMKDFLSAREIKLLTGTFKRYEDTDGGSAAPRGAAGSDSGVHSTYWPQMSDTEVPPLDLGWTSGGMFKGVTRVSVHTHPPKDNGPHIKEVVRKLIQEANKVIAIVMDILTDIQILQDLMDAASRRSVPVYILLDEQGMPHFLDMCSRLQIGAQHLRNIRTRLVQGVGFGLSCGRLPGSLCYKYMLVDGEKVMCGSYSFSWFTSRMDRNMITVMTGQVVDVFDQDFRELYAISEKLDLFKEFNVGQPTNTTATLRSKVGSKVPPRPATTSRFQVSLGDSLSPGIQVPAHKYYNPKYFLAFGDTPPRPTGSLQETGTLKGRSLANVPEEPGRPRLASSEKLERQSPLASEGPDMMPSAATVQKKPTFKERLRLKFSKKSRGGSPLRSEDQSCSDDCEDNSDVMTPSRWLDKNPSHLGSREESLGSVNTMQDTKGGKSQQPKNKNCKVS